MGMWLMIAALAQEPVVDPAVQQAEYVRVSEELRRAAQKNAWKGVERHYERALATGAKVQADVHLIAAQSARQAGDLGSMRTRLLAALATQPTNKQTLDDLLFLEANFARVELRSAPGGILEDYERPFDPLKLKAVDFAIAVIKETGEFSGLLPPGPYALNADPFELAPGQVFALDLRPAEPPPAAPVPVWKR